MFVLGKFSQRMYKLDQKYIIKGFFFLRSKFPGVLLWLGGGGGGNVGPVLKHLRFQPECTLHVRNCVEDTCTTTESHICSFKKFAHFMF